MDIRDKKMLDVKNEVLAAEKRIRSSIRETPLEYSAALSKLTGAHIYLKCENLQYTGSFKARGAFNKLLSLTREQKEKGVVVASSGNHGAAMGFALSHLKIPGIIFVPKTASPTKIDNIRNYDIPLELHGNDTMQTEEYSLEYASLHNMIYASPYNDPAVIGGQGTIGLELSKQLKKIDAVFVAIGGGGLIAGIAGYLKTVSPNIRMIGCLPENSPVMSESIKAGKIIEMETRPTLSDATAGGIEVNAITFEICQHYIDEYFLVSEEEIKKAIVTLIKTQHLLVEGASGVALATALKQAKQFKNKNIVIVLSGANIGIDTLKTILETCTK